MAVTTLSTDLEVKQWEDNFFIEYVRDNRFKRYMGTDENSVIQVKEDLTKKKGDRITVAFVGRLQNSGVTGNAALSGNEEALSNYGWAVDVDKHRNGVVVYDFDEQKSAIDLRNAARQTLKMWAMEKLRGGTGQSSRFGIIDNLYSVYDGTTYSLYGAASEAVKDAWLANNSDRVLFGAATSNNASNDHSAALANIDNTADKLTAATVSLAKRLAKKADPHIRPIRVGEDEEWHVVFAGSESFRDLKTDSTITQANREAWVRFSGGFDGGSNPLFRDSDLVYDGMIIREVPEIQVLEGVGAGSIDVTGNFLCGAQALANVWARRPVSKVKKEDDYGNEFGVAIEEIRGCDKLYFNDVQHGVFTLYTAAVA